MVCNVKSNPFIKLCSSNDKDHIITIQTKIKPNWKIECKWRIELKWKIMSNWKWRIKFKSFTLALSFTQTIFHSDSVLHSDFVVQLDSVVHTHCFYSLWLRFVTQAIFHALSVWLFFIWTIFSLWFFSQLKLLFNFNYH